MRVRACGVAFLVLFFVSFMASVSMAAPVGDDVRVAVLPFDVHAGDDLAYLNESLPELLSDKLAEAGFDVVPQADVKKMLEERGVANVSDKSAREIALALGAGFSVYGTLNQIGETISLDARIVDAFDDEPAYKATVNKQGLINLLPAVDDLVVQMRSGLLRQDVVAEVDVEGTKVLDKEVVLMRLPLDKGDLITAKAINTALKSVYELGYFDNVKVKVSDVSGGKRVVFEVVEKPRIQAIGVVGSDAIDSEDIIEAISTKKGGVVNPRVLADDINTIREMYRKEGYYKAKVSHEIETGESGQARLNFVIDEGNKLYIQEIVIDGAKQIDPDDVKDQLALQERGFLSFITNSGVLKEEFLERDTAAIMAYYNNHGFIEARVGRPEVDIKDDGIYVTFRVWEGERYKMGTVGFRGDLIDDNATLLDVVSVDQLHEDDDYFNRSIAQEDIKHITEYYNNAGYAYTDVSMKLNDNPETKVVDVMYTISKHQKVHIRRVLLEGNITTRDNVILRAMRLADGDQFSGTKLNMSTRKLDRLGYFESVNVTPVQTGNPDEMDLLVKVKEKPTGNFGGGVGYSTFDGAFIGANIGEKNLFGKGYSLNLAAQLGEKKTAFDLGFYNPMVYDSNLGFGARAYNKQQDLDDYERDSVGSTFRLHYPLGNYTSVDGEYAIEHYEIHDVSSDADSDIKDDEGTHLLSSLALKLKRDTLDNREYPTSGYVWTGKMTYGGGLIGGTDNFVKYTMKTDYYQDLFWKTVFHWKGFVGFVHENIDGGEIPSDQRFKLGGIDSVRGYSKRKIVAMKSDGSDKIGGDKAFYTNLEVIIPVSDDWGIQFVPFFDLGNVWKEGEFWFDSVERFNEDGPDFGLYKSVGAEVRWNSPLGPLRVSYGMGLDDLYDSKEQVFDFSVGQTF
ncbi:outer membrane protein assembly factor BamA [Pseudodesulfovibrio senegalensis]|uniref:Outer membrane protein assembly factor BamA n=1 Tax=Pseudodesulfovibrio senegalensis TaxID=1721087 RepID=A0A6N6N6U2_9BACT|nr:outer membrane protein assembly factor BamA [Pseudodesulfovibrio senegalensis]